MNDAFIMPERTGIERKKTLQIILTVKGIPPIKNPADCGVRYFWLLKVK